MDIVVFKGSEQSKKIVKALPLDNVHGDTVS